MSIVSALSRLLGSSAGALSGSSYDYRARITATTQPVELPPAELYRLLRILYLSADSYGELARQNVAIGRNTAQIKSIRSPIVPVVQWFSGKTFPKPLEIVTEHEVITPAIEQVWKWSNWRAKQGTLAGWSALFGEAFIKVNASPERGRVWFEYLEPEYVTVWEEDSRGYLVYVRIDIPKEDPDAIVGARRQTHTEEWSTDTQTYRQWLTDGDASGRKIADLGSPLAEIPYSTFGIDWTPLVRFPFSDVGLSRGIGAVQLALEAIFEADLSATNLHAMLYTDAEGAWVATAAGIDGAGRPTPALRVASAEPTFDALGRQTSNGTGSSTDGSISVGKRSFWRLPGGYDLKSVVADIDYAAALAILKDNDEHLERLMPALAYARISMLAGDLSGRAIRYRMAAAVDQVMDVRATALEKLQQADAMALTLGQVNGIPGFDGLGSFDDGDFQHEFAEVAVVEIDDLETAQGELAAAQALGAWVTAGLPLSEALKRIGGYSEEEIADIVNLAAQEAEAALEQQQELMAAQGDQQQGVQGND